MRIIGASIAAALLLAGSTAHAEERAWVFDVPPPATVEPLADGTPVKSVSLARVVIQLNPGQTYGRLRRGVFCEEAYPMKWTARASDDPIEAYRPVFFEVMDAAGFKTDGDTNNLFSAMERSPSDLQVAVAFKEIRAAFCERIAFPSDNVTVFGKVLIEAEWQVYSRVKGEVIARIKTRGGYELQPKGSSDGAAITLKAAFADNVRQLAASEAFRAAVLDHEPTLPGLPGADMQPIRLSAVVGSAKRPISDAVGSVVAIFAGDALGSAFLVSDDGYLISNRHVVGDAKYVKVRWSDGFETVGEVVRSHKARDIALIKTSPHGRQPLALRRAILPAGEAVYAIGSPLDPKLQGTVTKGIVSANRIVDGFNFIQSDVSVNGGNSGGPLLDENGAVVGVTVSGYDINNAPVGLNFFIPIGDALDFLALQPGT